MKIKELEVGKSFSMPLVVIAATPKETKAKKPYLALELFDGTDKISGNYWDWAGISTPDKNTILDVVGTCTEWLGSKQLNISKITTNKELDLLQFMPSSGHDTSTAYKDLYAIASEINDDFYRSLCLGVLEELMGYWLTAPAATGAHHAYTAGTLIHSLSVTKIASAIGEQIPEANIDLIVTGAMLHDLGKLFGYKINGVVCEMTDEGKLLDHLFIGAEFIGNYAEKFVKTEFDVEKLTFLRHIILAHHGLQEHGAVVPPAMLEAHIVFHADATDAAAEMIRDACKKVGENKWTEKVYYLGNKPHITLDYTKMILQG